MPETRRPQLQRLIERWQGRRRAGLETGVRPRADAEREQRADAFFPWRTQTPAEYAATYGAAMSGYTYDAYAYSDPKLEAWLRELGELLQPRRC